MAAQKVNVAALAAKIVEDVRKGDFAPVYLLMGDEPYYPELVCKAIVDNCIDESSKDFNETVCYGVDVTVEQVITAARRYPMMADRQLVVVKDAQLLKNLEQLSLYCAEPLDTTVLVILMRKDSADKRKALYKSVLKCGVVLESPVMRDYEMPSWIENYYKGRGLSIDADAAGLLAEYAGTDLSTIAVETDKLLKVIPDGSRVVTVSDIEKNVGVSRQFSVFELTKALSYHRSSDAIRLATHIGAGAKFRMPSAVSPLFTHFYRILRYDALLLRNPRPSEAEKGAALLGLNRYFFNEYDVAVRHYPLKKAMAAVSLLCDYDYLGKGGDGGATEDGDLLVELTLKLLNL